MSSAEICSIIGSKDAVFTSFEYIDFEFQDTYLDKKASVFIFSNIGQIHLVLDKTLTEP